MVALDEYFHHKGPKPRSRSRNGSEAARSEKSLARRTADILSPRRRRATSVSSFTSCANFNNRQSVPNSFVSLCLGGETRHRRGTSISPGFQNRPLIIVHCSLIFERSADEYGDTFVFTAPGPDGLWFTDDDVQSSVGANEIIYCGHRFDPEGELYYVRNQTYSPIFGRWLQREPIGYAGGVNLYEYVGSAPAMATDEHGTFAHNAQTATWGEIGSWAYLCPGGKFTPGIPAGLEQIFDF